MADLVAVRLRAVALLFVWAAHPAAAADRENPADLIRRVAARVEANTAQMENYTCVETIRRDYYRPAASTLAHACSALMAERLHPTPDLVLKLEATDRLRLDVAITERGEIFAWAGASRFEDVSVDQVVRDGPIGTGAFSAFLSVIFELDVKRFTVVGPITVNGRRLMEFAFDVPQNRSHYMVKLKNSSNRVAAGYSGSVFVDPDTAEPVRLNIRTAELPEDTGSCQSMSSLDYSRVQIGTRRLLLPGHSTQRFVARDGRETENVTSFASCREYSSESTVNFYQDPAPATPGAKTPAAAPSPVPAGMHFAFQLNAPIEADMAAVGDRFTGKLTEALRDGRRVIAPKGATVEGRITTLKLAYLPTPAGLLGLSPRRIQFQNVTLPLTALPDERSVVRPNQKIKARGLEIFLPPRGDYSGIFRFSGTHYVFPRGFTSHWMSVFQPAAR